MAMYVDPQVRIGAVEDSGPYLPGGSEGLLFNGAGAGGWKVLSAGPSMEQDPIRSSKSGQSDEVADKRHTDRDLRMEDKDGVYVEL